MSPTPTHTPELQALLQDERASRIELQWLRKEASSTRASRAAEIRDLRRRLNASLAQASRVPDLRQRIRDLKQKYRIMKVLAKLRSRVFAEAMRLRKELDGSRRVNCRLRREIETLQRSRRSVKTERESRRSVNGARIGSTMMRGAGVVKVHSKRAEGARGCGRRALGLHIDPMEVARARDAMEKQNGGGDATFVLGIGLSYNDTFIDGSFYFYSDVLSHNGTICGCSVCFDDCTCS